MDTLRSGRRIASWRNDLNKRSLVLAIGCALVCAGCGKGSPEEGKSSGAGLRQEGPVAGSPALDAAAGGIRTAAKPYPVRAVEDPAMARAATGAALPGDLARDFATDATIDPQAVVSPAVAESEPSRFFVDAEGQRVFLPGVGWKTVDEFWETYYHRPQDIPGDIDHDALAAIRRGER